VKGMGGVEDLLMTNNNLLYYRRKDKIQAPRGQLILPIRAFRLCSIFPTDFLWAAWHSFPNFVSSDLRLFCLQK
jgi:hypothetical protein